MIKVIVYQMIEEIPCKTMSEAYKVWSDKMDNLKMTVFILALCLK